MNVDASGPVSLKMLFFDHDGTPLDEAAAEYVRNGGKRESALKMTFPDGRDGLAVTFALDGPTPRDERSGMSSRAPADMM